MRVFCMFFLFLPDLDVSLVPTAKMSPVKMVEHVLTVWTVLSVSVTRALGEKGKWFLSSFILAAPFHRALSTINTSSTYMPLFRMCGPRWS